MSTVILEPPTLGRIAQEATIPAADEEWSRVRAIVGEAMNGMTYLSNANPDGAKHLWELAPESIMRKTSVSETPETMIEDFFLPTDAMRAIAAPGKYRKLHHYGEMNTAQAWGLERLHRETEAKKVYRAEAERLLFHGRALLMYLLRGDTNDKWFSYSRYLTFEQVGRAVYYALMRGESVPTEIIDAYPTIANAVKYDARPWRFTAYPGDPKREECDASLAELVHEIPSLETQIIQTTQKRDKCMPTGNSWKKHDATLYALKQNLANALRTWDEHSAWKAAVDAEDAEALRREQEGIDEWLPSPVVPSTIYCQTCGAAIHVFEPFVETDCAHRIVAINPVGDENERFDSEEALYPCAEPRLD